MYTMGNFHVNAELWKLENGNLRTQQMSNVYTSITKPRWFNKHYTCTAVKCLISRSQNVGPALRFLCISLDCMMTWKKNLFLDYSLSSQISYRSVNSSHCFLTPVKSWKISLSRYDDIVDLYMQIYNIKCLLKQVHRYDGTSVSHILILDRLSDKMTAFFLEFY